MPRPKRQDLNGPFNVEILAVMDARGWTKIEEFADHFGIGRTTAYNLVQGRQTSGGDWIKPSLDTVLRLAMALQKPVDELLERLYPDLDLPKASPQPLPSSAQVQVRIVGILGAGPGENQEADGVITVDKEFAKGKDLVGFLIRGDSMAGGKRPIYSGDKVLVNKLDKGRSGQIVAARLKDGSHVCKALKDDRFGKRLMSMNPLYTNSVPPIIADVMVEEVLGRVVLNQGPVDSAEV